MAHFESFAILTFMRGREKNFARVTFLLNRLRDLRKMTIFAPDEMAENQVRSSQEPDYKKIVKSFANFLRFASGW